jgi:hypothetical protein
MSNTHAFARVKLRPADRRVVVNVVAFVLVVIAAVGAHTLSGTR